MRIPIPTLITVFVVTDTLCLLVKGETAGSIEPNQDPGGLSCDYCSCPHHEIVGPSELDLRHRGHGFLILDGEVGFRCEVEEILRGQVGRKIPDAFVEFCDLIDVPFPGDGDAVLRAFELRLEIAEVAVGFQVRVLLNHDKEPRQGSGQLLLRLLELVERRLILQ